MDEVTSLERRYNFNMAQNNPVVETEHIGGSFPWGSMSSKYRSYSSLCLNTHVPSDGNKSNVSARNKTITKIDSRIAADVQSKGLASRIVKYHESGTRLNRSISAHNLYSKPGQFPVVTLKRTDLPYRATRKELSMIRIPPPDKSSFYGNTVSSLLRSSSVIGFPSKRSEDLSRENRPIIHPPPTANDLTPTRSVLDVLKEISRKRINSDELESEETSKKYCNRGGNDIVDTISNTACANAINIGTSTLSSQRHKRQRDYVALQNIQLSESKTSPEQAKKRVCNYNNDITSSLSSSINRRKLSVPHNLNQTMPKKIESHEVQKSKMQRCDDFHNDKNNTIVDMRFENLNNTLGQVDAINSISPIPATPCSQDQISNAANMDKQTVLESFSESDRKASNLIQPTMKPRLTLFNKKCDDSDQSHELETESADDLNYLEDCAGISFVKPKKIMTINGLKNPVMERTQKSKLALMLSGLKGELYSKSDIDELDSPNKSKQNQASEDNYININTSIVISPLKSTNTVTTLPTVTSSSNVETPITSNTLNFPTITKTTSVAPTSSTTLENKTSPLVGLKLSQTNTSPEKITNILKVDTTKINETQSKSNIPLLSGFSFGVNNSTSPSLVNTSFSNNIPKDCQTTITPVSINSTSNANLLSFGQPTQLNSVLTLDDKTNKLPLNMQPSKKNDVLPFPAVCTAFTILTTNTKTSSTTTSTLCASKIFSSNSSMNTSSISVPAESNSAKPSKVFTFIVPSTSLPNTTTSSLPIFGTSISSTTVTKTTMPTIAVTTAGAITINTAVTSENSSTSSFTSSATKKPLTNEATVSSSGETSSVSFKIDESLPATPVTTFGTNMYSSNKAQPTSFEFSFSSNTNTQHSTSINQNNQEVAKQTDNNIFSQNASTLFNSQCFNTKATGASAANFCNDTNSSGNVFNSSSATSNLASSFVKQTFSNASNKSEILVNPKELGSSNINSSTLTPFSFGSKSTAASFTNQNNPCISPGGFSFSSGASNGIFGFANKSIGQTNTVNDTLSGVSALTSQNKNFTFGSSTKESDNSASIFSVGTNKAAGNSSGGFSFGSAPSTKSPTFTFGVDNNTSSENINTSVINVQKGFAFGGSAVSKSNQMPNYTPFSFGTPQPTLQKPMQSVSTSSANSSNIFSLSGATKIAQPPTFNFNSGNSTNSQPNAPTINNIFATPSNVITGPGDRPIRRATRRLQK